MPYTAQPMPGYKAQVMLASGSTSGTNLSLTNGGDNQTFTVPLADVHRYLDRAIAPVVQVEQDDIQTVSISGSPTGGTFTLTFGGQTTSAIAYNASAATVQAALVALSSIGSGNVSVSGGPGPGTAWVVEFIGTLADAAQTLMTHTDSFTGGSSPQASIAHTQTGQTWTTISSTTYTLRNLTAQVKLNTPLLGTNVNLRLSTFNYYPYAAIAQAWDLTFAVNTQMLDVTVFQGSTGTGFSSFLPGIVKGTFAAKAWAQAPGTDIYVAHLVARDLLILSFFEPNGLNYAESYVYMDATTLMANLTTASEEDLSFTCDSIVSLI